MLLIFFNVGIWWVVSISLWTFKCTFYWSIIFHWILVLSFKILWIIRYNYFSFKKTSSYFPSCISSFNYYCIMLCLGSNRLSSILVDSSFKCRYSCFYVLVFLFSYFKCKSSTSIKGKTNSIQKFEEIVILTYYFLILEIINYRTNCSILYSCYYFLVYCSLYNYRCRYSILWYIYYTWKWKYWFWS